MIKVIFKCNTCGCTTGTIITHDRTTEVECDNCKLWETMGEETSADFDFVLAQSTATKANSILSSSMTAFKTVSHVSLHRDDHNHQCNMCSEHVNWGKDFKCDYAGCQYKDKFR